MNRAQRRASGAPKEPTYTLTKSQIEQMKKDCTEDAVNTAFKLMLCIPATVIHDKFGEIMKKEGRLEKFVDLVLDLYDSYNRDYVSLDDLEQYLKEETGISFEKIRQKRLF